VGYSPDGRTVAAADHLGGSLKLYELASGKERASFVLRSNWPLACAFSPDGQLLAVPTGETNVRLIRLGGRQWGDSPSALKGETLLPFRGASVRPER
jgi:hypothetical protein